MNYIYMKRKYGKSFGSIGDRKETRKVRGHPITKYLVSPRKEFRQYPEGHGELLKGFQCLRRGAGPCLGEHFRKTTWASAERKKSLDGDKTGKTETS